MSDPEKLYVVGQRRDGSYETFELSHVPDGEGLDMAAEVCASRRGETTATTASAASRAAGGGHAGTRR
jgi:hypothetical protein